LEDIQDKPKQEANKLIDQIFNAKHGLQDDSDQRLKEENHLSPVKKDKREPTIEDTLQEYERKLVHADKFNNDTVESDDDIKKINYKVKPK
jgi:hypothetical protein